MYLQVFIVGLLAGISPGPDFFVVTKNSLGSGRWAGISTALGIGAALIIHVSYTILGFAWIIQHYPEIFHLIQLLGAAYLVRLAIPALLAKIHKDSSTIELKPELQLKREGWLGFRDGFFCNVLNPKAPLFYLSIFAQFLTPGTPGWVRWIYGLETILAVGSWFIFLSVVISSGGFRELYQRFRHWVDRILGAVLLYFAGRIIWSVIRSGN